MAVNFKGLRDAVAFGALNEFLATFNSGDGYSRPNRYEVVMKPPSGTLGSNQVSLFSQLMGEKHTNDSKAVSLRCEAIAFPGRNMDTTPDSNLYGPEREVVTGYSFPDITATFQCSSDMREKLYFETWQGLTFNQQDFSLGYYDDYTGELDIVALDEQDNRRYGVRLRECFPKAITEQPLSYANGASYQTVSITFAYRFWENMEDEANPVHKPLLNRVAENAVSTVSRSITANLPAVLRRL